MTIRDEIVNFLHDEAFLLDERRFDEWLEMLDDSVVYRMPMRVTKEKEGGDDIVDEMTYLEETKQSLITRVNRLKTTSAWAEDPPSRTRHFITNVRIEREEPEEVHVTSYFHMLRSRGSTTEVEQVFGKRSDVVKKRDGNWRLVRRTIYPDQAILGMRNISNFF
ncbi:3-phenylpropionate/cinnamic acid dioxygenase subunit beta [Alicyclobacillus kakegawensis]|uniref:3-phenylpropionate/cinnamic acid dioxygenase subunit beta n=1 Tax=Alicyclobacillus kakegawensis TaxID=392012 RepID=UPI0008357D1C|nr:3-phenylpropionate/cinnamic acid dioxygenase subunit beta [Alicyclobacillus kakegawensis]